MVSQSTEFSDSRPGPVELGPGRGRVLLARVRAGAADKDRLARSLWLAWTDRGRAKWPGLGRDRLGRPFLRPAGDGPSISFSRRADRLWGALADRPGLGLDLASEAEFGPGYPLRRAFGRAELRLAAERVGPEPGLGAALLWAVKEATVKCWGSGFHRLDPLDLEIHWLEPKGGGWSAGLRGAAGVDIRVTRRDGAWLALAATGHPGPETATSGPGDPRGGGLDGRS